MPHRFSRRRALQLIAGCAAFVASLPRRAWAIVLDHFPTRTVERGEFNFDPESGVVRYEDGRQEDYSLTIDGLTANPLSLSWAELMALPQTEQVSDFHCVEGWSVHDVRWSGVTFDTLFSSVQPRPEAHYAVFHSLGKTRALDGFDHYVESFPIAWLLERDLGYLLALGLDGAPLPQERGAPARVVCPYDLAYKSIKFVTRIELTAEKQPGWWTLASSIYPWNAPVPADRLRRPMPPRRL